MQIETQLAKRPEFSPRSIAVSLWRNRLAIAITWLVFSALTIVVVLRLPRIYQAEATVLVQQQVIPEKYVTSTVGADVQTRLELLKQRVLSVDVLTRLMSEYKLYEAERQSMTPEEVITKFRDDISMRLVHGWSNERLGTFVVGYTGRDPVVVAELTNRIARFFIDGNGRDRQDLATGTVEFLSRESERAKADLDREDAKMQQVRMRFNGELPEQETALTASVLQLKARLTAIQESLNGAFQTRTFLQSTLGSAQASEAMTKSVLEQQQREIARLQNERKAAPVPAAPVPPTEAERIEKELEAARTRYSDQHPEIQRLLASYARAKAHEGHSAATQAGRQANDQPVDTSEIVSVSTLPVVTEVQQRTGNLIAQLAAVEKQVQDLELERQKVSEELNVLQARMERIPLHSQQIAAATREADVARSNYRSLLDKKLEASVTANMETRRRGERLELLDPARVPQQPIKPKRKLLAAAGSIFGLLMACFAAFGMEWRRDVILGEWELPEGITVLARVPVIPASSGEPSAASS